VKYRLGVIASPDMFEQKIFETERRSIQEGKYSLCGGLKVKTARSDFDAATCLAACRRQT